MKQTKVISVVNQKGGVGKTTTAINIASFLSERNIKTLLIDTDPQANATSGVGLQSEKIRENLYHLLVNNEDIKRVIYPSPFPNLHVIPASRELAGAEVEMVPLVSRETLLKERISVLEGCYEYVIIDCPPSLGLLTLNSLVASDKVIIPVQCEYFALEGVSSLIDTVYLVKENFNPNLEIAGIILTMFDKRTALNRQVALNAKDFFKDLVFNTVVPRNIRLTEAPSHGLPIALYHPDSAGALAYSELTQEVMARV